MRKREAQLRLRKLSFLLKDGLGRITFSKHFKDRIKERNLVWSPDALNVIHAGNVVFDGQLEKKNGQY